MSAPMLRVIIFTCCIVLSVSGRIIKEDDIPVYRQKVLDMFHHAYDGYIEYAYPLDELRPLTCDGHDTWGSYSLTLIDALDMLVIIGNNTEFQRVAQLVLNKMDFNVDINVSVFETNIRIVGGLLSAHLMSKKAGMSLEPGWPCTGPFLRLAEDVGRRLLPAFDTPTGMPYGTVNLKYGVPSGETTVTCTAGVGTMIIEFGALSKLTGDPIFEKAAMRAMNSLWEAKSTIGLVGNHIDVATGKWTALDAGIGGGVDSYFEYLVKGSIMFHNPQLLEMYQEYFVSVEKYLKRDDWYMWAHMTKGSITLPMFTSLDCYLPGIQALLGDIDKGMKTIHNFHQVWKQFGFLPEYYNIVKNEVHAGREGYPLRPELIEAAMYLYQATKDPYLLEIGVDMIESIEHNTRTKCGYATVKDVNTHTLENRMESFFLAETTKYLYLLFDPDNFIHNTGNHGDVIQTPNGQCIIDTGSYIFNTEAHPIDTAALYCCSAEKKQDDAELEEFHDNLDLLALFDITDTPRTVHEVKWNRKKNETDSGTLGNKQESSSKGDNLFSKSSTKGDDVLSTVQQAFTVGKNYRNMKIVINGNNIQIEHKDKNSNLDEVHTDKIKAKDIFVENKDKNLEVAQTDNNNDKDINIAAEDIGNDKESCEKDGNCDKNKISDKHEKDKYTASHGVSDEDKSDDNVETANVDADDDEENVEDDFDLETQDIMEEINQEKNIIQNEEDEIRYHENQNKKNGISVVIANKHKDTSKQLITKSLKYSEDLIKSEKPKLDVLEILKSLTSDILMNSGVKSLKTLHEKLKYYSLLDKPRPELMTCKAQPFHMRFSIMGEMFMNDV